MVSARATRVALLGAVLAVWFLRAEAVELTMRDTTFYASDTLHIQIFADSIAETPGVLSYQFVIQFDSAVLVGVGGESAGTISEPFGDPFTSGDSYPGELRIAAAGIQPVSGSGPFVTVLLRAATDSGGVTAIRFHSALLNEGSPPVTYPDPLATVTVLAAEAVGPRPPRSLRNRLAVSPNPSSGYITVDLPANSAVQRVRVWNVLGQQVTSQSATTSRMVLNLTPLPGGTYFITLDQQPEFTARIYLLR